VPPPNDDRRAAWASGADADQTRILEAVLCGDVPGAFPGVMVFGIYDRDVPERDRGPRVPRALHGQGAELDYWPEAPQTWTGPYIRIRPNRHVPLWQGTHVSKFRGTTLRLDGSRSAFKLQCRCLMVAVSPAGPGNRTSVPLVPPAPQPVSSGPTGTE
jgi:hypothetical protein